MEKDKTVLPLPWMKRADMAARETMKKLVEERRKSGIPLAVLRDGKVVLVPADEIKIDETTNGSPAHGMIDGD